MTNLTNRFASLNYLAGRMAESDSFETDARAFADLVETIRYDLYDYTDAQPVLDRLDAIPALDLAPHQRSLLEQLLPRGGRDMVGNYQVKQKILAQVGDITKSLNRIRDMLPLPPAQDDFV